MVRAQMLEDGQAARLIPGEHRHRTGRARRSYTQHFMTVVTPGGKVVLPRASRTEDAHDEKRPVFLPADLHRGVDLPIGKGRVSMCSRNLRRLNVPGEKSTPSAPPPFTWYFIHAELALAVPPNRPASATPRQ